MGPLHGVRVVEMDGLAPGPYCAMMLADMGAEVLRIVRPEVDARPGDPRTRLLNRNRRAVAVDLKNKEGTAFIRRLLLQADVLIEGFRPGVMERLGLGPEVCLAANSRLVYGRMTGWGQDGPLAAMAGHDINYIALTGVLDAIGPSQGPPSVPLNLVGDFGGGGMLLAFGIACALIERSTSGHGQVVDAAMVDGASSLMTYMYAMQAAGRWTGRGENGLSGAAPHYGVYETSDGKFVSIGASEAKFWARLLTLLGLNAQELPARNNPANWPALRASLAAVFSTRTRDAWCTLLQDEDVCFAPVLTLAEATRHRHLIERGTHVTVEGIVQPAPAPRFSRTAPEVPTSPVEAGSDLVAALKNWGFDAGEADALARSGVVR